MDLCDGCASPAIPPEGVLLARAKDQRNVLVWVMQALKDTPENGTVNVFSTLDGTPVCITVRKGSRRKMLKAGSR